MESRPPSSRKIAIVQSNYIPWKGYFDLIHLVDEFILFDDAQYTRRDWRNRNKIKTAQGAQWLSIPVQSKGRYFEPIKNITISDPQWAEQHWKAITAHYARAPYFKAYEELFRDLYLGCRETRLSAINHGFIAAICRLLGIRTKLSWSMDYEMIEGKTERLVHFCRQAGGTEYVSGPTAEGYISASMFQEAGITLSFSDYSSYAEYPQLFPPFDHQVSILDLIFNVGPDATRHMITFDRAAHRFVRGATVYEAVSGA